MYQTSRQFKRATALVTYNLFRNKTKVKKTKRRRKNRMKIGLVDREEILYRRVRIIETRFFIFYFIRIREIVPCNNI